MIRQLNLNTENFWTIRIEREISRFIKSRRKRCIGFEDDIFQDVIVELLEEYQGNEMGFPRFINLYEKKELTKVIDRVSQEWTRALEKRKRKEKTIDHFEELIEAGNFQTWQLINRALTTHYSLLEAEGEELTDELLVNFLTTGTLTNNFPFTIYKGTEDDSLNGPIKEKNSENSGNKEIISTRKFYRSKLKELGLEIKTLEGIRETVLHFFPNFNLSEIIDSDSLSGRYFQFQNGCPICHNDGQCLSIAEKENGSIFYHCFHPDAAILLTEKGVKRKSIPKLLAIIADAEGQF